MQTELVASGGEPTETQRQRLARAEGKMRLANRLDLPLILLAGLTMAVARTCRHAAHPVTCAYRSRRLRYESKGDG